MAIKIGEIGKTIFVGTTFDMNAVPFTLITLKFTAPTGGTSFVRTTPTVTVPNVDSPNLANVGVLPANTYASYLTDGVDFDVVGDWAVCLQYEDAVPSLFSGDDTTVTVEGACT